METTKPTAEVVEDSAADTHREEEPSPADQDDARTQTSATRKPAGYIAAKLVTDPDSIYHWVHGTPGQED